MGGQLLRHAFDDCHRVEKETAKRAEEKKRREEERRQTASNPDSDSDSDDEDNCEVHVPLRAYATRHVVFIGGMSCIVLCRRCGSTTSTFTSRPRAGGRWSSTNATASK